MPNILLTSVGRRVELIRAFRSVYTQFGLPGRIFATDVDWLAPAMQFVDSAHLVPHTDSPEFNTAIVELCQNHEIDLVLPLIDPDIPVLAANRDAIEKTGAQVAVVDPAAANIASDKWSAKRFFAQHGLASPRSWLPDQSELENAEYPLFIKPRGGSAAQHTYRADDREELDFFLRRVPDAIVQEFLPGPEITCDVVCDLAGKVMAIVQRQRIAVRGGEAIKSLTVSHSALDAACRKIAQCLPARGPITVQCMMKNDRPYFIEINGRVGGGLPLAIAAGVNVPAMLLSLVTEIPQPALTTDYQVGMYMTRCDESVFITEADRDRAQRHHL
jgi:carbamoyl-phosphate synthase large subunit